MKLFLSAQDIDALELLLLDDGERVVASGYLPVPPERFLPVCVDWLQQQGRDWTEIDGLGVVVGPGSFTSTRIVTTIANGIAFAKRLPLVSLENPSREGLAACLRKQGSWRGLARRPQTRFAVPVYDRPPHITVPRSVLPHGDKRMDSPSSRW